MTRTISVGGILFHVDPEVLYGDGWFQRVTYDTRLDDPFWGLRPTMNWLGMIRWECRDLRGLIGRKFRAATPEAALARAIRSYGHRWTND